MPDTPPPTPQDPEGSSLGERAGELADGAADLASGAAELASGAANAASSACFIKELWDDATDDFCFVATAAHGDIDAPEVVLLRRYRDARLLTNTPGRVATAVYYRVGPYLAAVIRRYPALRRPARRALAPAVWWARRRTGSR